MVSVRLIKTGSRTFIAFVMIWTWCMLAVPVILGLGVGNIITNIAYALAGASPSVFALVLVSFSGDREYRHSFLTRIVRIGNTGAKDILVIFALVPAVTAVSAFIQFMFTCVPPDLSGLNVYIKDPVKLMAFAAFTLVFGPLAEEIGWRGYLLDCLKVRGILVYGAGIGFLWTLWHLPMFFIAGSYQNMLLKQGVIPVICFALSTIALGVIMGETANKTGSILSAILFHFMVNFTGELIPLAPRTEMIKTAVYSIIAFGIVYSHNHRRKGVCNGNSRAK